VLQEYIIQKTGMPEKLSSGYPGTATMSVPGILQRPQFVRAHFTHKILNKAALERFGSISA
jgi:hypothetical protein